jgi:hypothetical protein
MMAGTGERGGFNVGPEGELSRLALLSKVNSQMSM